MLHTAPPLRADHVVRLLRPPDLLQARDDFCEGRTGEQQETKLRRIVEASREVRR